MDWVSAPRVSSIGRVPVRVMFITGVIDPIVGSEMARSSADVGFGTNMVFRTSRRPLKVPSFRCAGPTGAFFTILVTVKRYRKQLTARKVLATLDRAACASPSSSRIGSLLIFSLNCGSALSLIGLAYSQRRTGMILTPLLPAVPA